MFSNFNTEPKYLKEQTVCVWREEGGSESRLRIHAFLGKFWKTTLCGL